MRGRFEEGAELLRKAEHVAEDIGHAYAMATLPLFTGRLLSLRGDSVTAERTLRSALDALTRVGDGGATVGATADLARVLLTLDRADEAGRLLSEPPGDGGGPQLLPAGWHGARARAFAQTGHAEQAITEAELALDAAARTDSPDVQATALLDQACVLSATAGSAAVTIEAARLSWQRYREKGNRVGMAEAAEFLRAAGWEVS
jgi:hypothetical protein